MKIQHKKLDLSPFPLLSDPITIRLFSIFSKAGITARFVGGCVRDAVLGIQATDLDIAVPVTPDQVVTLLRENHIHVIPTGIDHGTVTAVLNHRPYEITSLRHDWKTFGRKAKVSFNSDWRKDAERRDFTFNALYMDPDGTIYDYFHGLEDLEKGVVRFIGDPEKRIEEDYLRILRYFRFWARYGKSPMQEKDLQACIKLKSGLKNLSKERIRHEFLKLFMAPYSLQALKILLQTKIAEEILPVPLNVQMFENCLIQEEKLGLLPSVLRHFAAALWPLEDILHLKENLKLKKTEQHLFKFFSRHIKDYPATEDSFRFLIYRDGKETFITLQIFSTTLNSQNPSLIQQALSWEKPIFPISGHDVIEIGFKPGKKLKDALTSCEQWWIDNHFSPSKKDCLDWILQRKTS